MWLLYASLSTFFFGLRGILYQWTSQRPIQRNLMLLGVYTSGMIVALVANLFVGQPWTVGAWGGLLMGAFSYTSNAAMYRGFAEGKASLIAVFVALTPVVVALLAFFLWEETFNSWQMVAFVVIVTGIVLIRYSNELSLSNLQGVHWALLAMLFFGLTDVSTKQTTIWAAEALPTLAIMYSTGSVLFGLSAIRDMRTASRRQRAAVAPQGSSPALASAGEQPRYWGPVRTLLWGMFVGLTNVTGMMLIIPAFRTGITGLVSAVIAMNVVIILLYIRIFLKEKFTRMETMGIFLAIAGTIIMKLVD